MAPREESSSSSESTEKPKQISAPVIKRSNLNLKLNLLYGGAITITVIYFLGFIIYPWYSMREKWKVKSNYFISKNIQQKSIEIKSITEAYFAKIQNAVILISRLVVNTRMLSSPIDRYTCFIKLFHHFHSSIKPFPVSISIQEGNKRYYTTTWNSTERDFKFYTLDNINETHSTLMRYDSYTFRRNLNIEMGESDGIVENSRYFKECETVKKWTYVDEGEQKSLIYSACIPSANQGESFLTQIEINLTHFNQYFATYALINKSKYTFLDQYKRVVFESTNGMTQPTKEDAILNYPLIEELSGDIWGPISSQLNVSQENFSLRSFHYQNHFYFTILIPIKIEYDQTHYVILLCDFSEMIADSLWETTKVYFVYLMFAFLFNNLTLILGFASLKKRNKKFEAINNSIESYLVTDSGTMFKAIQQIRTLELNHPDESFLNKILDGVVNKIAQHGVHPYYCKANCPFCKQLVGDDVCDLYNDPDKCFQTWKTIIAPKIANYKTPGDLKFRWKMHQTHPVKYLIQLFSTIIVSEDLFFPEVDPNNLLEMVCYYAENFCQDPAIVALQLNAFHNLMHTQLKYWIPKKIDRLVSYICCIFFMSDGDKLCTHIVDKQLHAKRNDYKLPFETTKSIIGHQNFVELAYTIEIFEYISSYIPVLYNSNSPFTMHFRSIFLRLIQTQFVSNDLTFFGALRILVESPYFSPMDIYSDRIVLLQFLLSYASLAPFYSSSKIADEVSMKFLEFKGLDTYDQIFTTRFCIEIVKMIIIPMTNNLTKFISLDVQEKNLKNVIDHWTSKLKFLSATVSDSDDE